MRVTIMQGDVFAKLAELPDESVNCVVTSPPYWGLRDYGVNGQIGLEPTLAEHLDVMVRVFREVRRVLRKDGTCWVNYGDCYATTPNGRPAAEIGVLKPKDLCMIPNRLAIALQEDGWWVRSEVVWVKPNPMPESVRDRPACAHEKVFLLTRSERYFYDADAVRVPAAMSSLSRWNQNIEKQEGSKRANGGLKKNGPMKAVGGPLKDKQRGHGRRHAGFNDRWDHMTTEEQRENGRNLRNVWEIATRPFSEAHFATFPPDLVIPCIKAGCPANGVVLDPFGGAGTTGLVADRLGRNAILIELNPEYVEIARRRIAKDAGLFAEITA